MSRRHRAAARRGTGVAQPALASAETTYDEVAYPSLSHSIMHPEVMATLARLYALPAADIDACRVLELGCGDGAHIIPIAEAYPGSSFVGVDLSRRAVGRGEADIAALGLKNIRLEVADLLDWRPEPASFDYVVAHGLYAWTPPEVREAVMAIIGRALGEGGLALLSYNVAPGCNLRLIVREMVELEVRGVQAPAERAAAAHAALTAALADINPVHPLSIALEAEVRRWTEMAPESLLHDILAPCYVPARLPDVVAHGARHGLAYLGDADRGHVRREAFPGPLDERLKALSAGDPVAWEHRQDLRAGRAFRHTLLRKGPADFPRALDLAALRDMHVSLSRALGEGADLGVEEKGSWSITFGTSEGFEAKVGGAPAQRLVHRLAEVFPASLPVRELEAAGARLDVLALLYAAGGAKLWTQPLRIGTTPGPRPAATPFARLQARTGRRVTRLDHDMITLDPTSAKLLSHMDGRSTLAEIAQRLATDVGVAPHLVLAALPENLAALGKRALMLAT